MHKMDVLLRGCYLFRDMPFLRVTFIDVLKAFEIMGPNAVVFAKRHELVTYDSATGVPVVVDARISEPVSDCTCCEIHVLSSKLPTYCSVITPRPVGGA